MAAATSEPLVDYNNAAFIEDDQEVGGAGSVVSSGTRNLSPKLEKRERPFIKPVSQMTLMEQVTAIVAGFSILLSLVAMIIEGSIYVVISGLLSITMGTYAYYQQTQLTNLAILKEKTNSIEKEVGRLEGENTKLSYSVDELEGRVEDLLDVEDALEIIASSDGRSVDALEKDAVDNLEIAGQMQQSIQASVIETLISLIYSRQGSNDTDIDKVISEEDTTALIRKLEDIVGLSIYEDRLRDTVVGNSIESIIDTAQNLLDEDIPVKNRIFQVNNKNHK